VSVPSLPDSASKLLEDACWAAKSIVAELNPQILTFLHPILNVQGHILTAGGIARSENCSENTFLTQRTQKKKIIAGECAWVSFGYID
jgi:hypothetical protein